jgi:hypothetical protein
MVIYEAISESFEVVTRDGIGLPRR